MDEDWIPVEAFPGYSVSNRGRVRNDHTGRILSLTRNSRGITIAGMSRDHLQYKRAVDKMVGEAFLPHPQTRAFDAIIHLDGDVNRNDVTNLMWRPRWFRIAYHKQFRDPNTPWIMRPMYVVDTDEVFDTSKDVCVRYGLLAHDILVSMSNRTGVFPDGFEFRVYKE